MTEPREYSLNWAPNAIQRTPGADEIMQHAMCYTVGGVHYCKADSLMGGVLPVDGVHWVDLGLAFRGTGLHMPYAPDTAREVAHTLLRAADKAEELNAAASAAQLAAALAKGGQANG